MQRTKLVEGEEIDIDDLRTNGHSKDGDGYAEPLDPPRLSSSSSIPGSTLYRIYRARRKEKKLAGKGYIRWYLVGDGWPEPKFIKPERDGTGIPRYKLDGDIYLFPKEALLPSRASGMWTIVHKQGEAEPINLKDPTKDALKADEVSEWLDKLVTSNPPSFWDKFDADAEDIIMYMVVGIVGIALLQQFLGGGF